MNAIPIHELKLRLAGDTVHRYQTYFQHGYANRPEPDCVS